VKLRRQGADLLGLCPFHEDHEPSLVISPTKNLWHCLGACQAGGSPIDWVMRERGVSFRHAVELLRADLPFAAESRPPRGGTVRTLPLPVEVDADDSELLSQVIGYYHRTLQESPEALQYLEQRGLRSQEAVDRFQLGFANRTLGLRLPLGNRRSGAEIRARLQRLGILRETGHEHFNGSLVVPVIDAAGRVTEMYGRKVTRNLRAGTPDHLYLPGPREGGRGVWNEAAMAAGEEVILCEALLDALTFWVHGIRNVTAAYGAEGFTGDHLEALRRHGIRRVHIAYDRDAAGERAAVQLGERLAALGIETYRVHLPQGEDVNSYACSDLPRRVSPTDQVRSQIAELFASGQELGAVLEQVARLGVRLLMQTALDAEVTEWLGRDWCDRGEPAHAGYRNGYQPPLTIKTSFGPVELQRPKLRGTDEAFASRLLGMGVTKTNALESLVIAGSSGACPPATSRPPWPRPWALRRRSASRR
jgi:DNA primase